MFKKGLAIGALALVSIFALPAAANAAYVPAGNIIVTGDTSPGGAVTVTFTDGSFAGGELVQAEVEGDPTANFAALGFVGGVDTTTATANDAGAVSFTYILPSNASGSYTLTATGLGASGNVGVATITVTPADSGGTTGPGGLVNTGSELSALVIWCAIGALLIGTALVTALQVRRNRAHTHA